MDLQSRRRWEDYTKAKETMFERTHIPEAPWWVVEGNNKKRARLNCIAHLLKQIPYKEVPRDEVQLPIVNVMTNTIVSLSQMICMCHRAIKRYGGSYLGCFLNSIDCPLNYLIMATFYQT